MGKGRWSGCGLVKKLWCREKRNRSPLSTIVDYFISSRSIGDVLVKAEVLRKPNISYHFDRRVATFTTGGGYGGRRGVRRLVVVLGSWLVTVRVLFVLFLFFPPLFFFSPC